MATQFDDDDFDSGSDTDCDESDSDSDSKYDSDSDSDFKYDSEYDYDESDSHPARPAASPDDPASAESRLRAIQRQAQLAHDQAAARNADAACTALDSIHALAGRALQHLQDGETDV